MGLLYSLLTFFSFSRVTYLTVMYVTQGAVLYEQKALQILHSFSGGAKLYCFPEKAFD